MKKRLTAASLAALMAVTTLPISACAAASNETDGAPVPQLNTADHMQYMNGYADGTFQPGANITRGQMAKILYNLM